MQNLAEMGLLSVFPVPHNQAVHFLRLTFVISEILYCPQPTIVRKTREYSLGNFKTVNFFLLPVINVVCLTTPPASLYIFSFSFFFLFLFLFFLFFFFY